MFKNLSEIEEERDRHTKECNEYAGFWAHPLDVERSRSFKNGFCFGILTASIFVLILYFIV